MTVFEWAAIVATATFLIPRAVDFAATVARYRRYRRSYPYTSRGDVWRHVR